MLNGNSKIINIIFEFQIVENYFLALYKTTMKLTFLFLIFFFPLFCFAQPDSLQNTSYEKYSFNKNDSYIPAALMTGGIITSFNNKKSPEKKYKEEKKEHLFGFTNGVDDYAQFAPFAAAYAFEWAGMQPRTDWKNRTAIMIKGQIVNLGMVFLLKKTINNNRPDGSQYSFPSGHTANAFAGATLLSMEYGKNHKWVPYAAYTVAGGVGIMRITKNKHYLSDVLFGAGLGIISMKLAYWTHQYKWNIKKSEKDPFAEIHKSY